MDIKFFTPRFLFVGTAILLAAISRILPHPPNFTPIAAMALFGGAYFHVKGKRAEGKWKFTSAICHFTSYIPFIIPLLAMFFSDCILEWTAGIGFHNTILYVYGSFILITFIGIFISNKVKAGNIVLASLISSVLFFLVTNFGVWQVSVPIQSGAASGFSLGLNGLLATYIAGIPFYHHSVFGSFFFNTIIGDLFYCGVLFGSFYFARVKFPALAKA